MDDAPSIKDINELLSYLESSSYGTEDSNDKVEAAVKATADSIVDSENYQQVAEMEKVNKKTDSVFQIITGVYFPDCL